MGSTVTCLLEDWVQNKEGALDRLLPTVLPELREIAQSHLKRERAHHTLQPTEIVNEAFLKLVSAKVVGFESRGHFFALASQLVRKVLVDHARTKGRLKRGGGQEHVPLEALGDDALPYATDFELILAVDEGLSLLEQRDPRQSQVVVMRFFAGLSMPQIAQEMGLSLATVERLWGTARYHLARSLTSDSGLRVALDA